MESISLKAHAKINLSLDVIGKRQDGYHEVRMIMQSIALHDEVVIEKGLQESKWNATSRGCPKEAAICL